MLTLPTITNTRIGQTVRHPVVAFELYFSVIIRIANHLITWDGKTFLKAGLEAKSFQTGKAGIQTGRIEFINANFVYTSITFAEVHKGIPAIGYLFYGDGPFAAGDEIKFFEGEIIKPVRVQDTVVFDVATVATQSAQIPDFTLSPPDVNYLPYPNQTFNWEGENYQVVY